MLSTVNFDSSSSSSACYCWYCSNPVLVRLVCISFQAKDALSTARLASAEQQCSVLQSRLTAAEASAQDSASAATEAVDRIPALEHQLRRGDAKLAAANSQMSSLQHRLAEANRLLAASGSATARLESDLEFANSELVSASAASRQLAELSHTQSRDALGSDTLQRR